MWQAGATLHRGARAFSLSWPLVLRSTGSRRSGSLIMAHGPSCSAACGIFPDQSSNPCPLHWQADSQPLRHQGSPRKHFLNGHIPGLAHTGFFFFFLTHNTMQRNFLCLFLPSQYIPTNLPQRTLGLILSCPSSLSILTTVRRQGLHITSHPVVSRAHTAPCISN